VTYYAQYHTIVVMPESAIRRTIRAFYANYIFDNAEFALGIYLIYFHEYLGLTFTQGLLIYVISNASMLAFDLFGGGIADVRGRKRAYMAGTAVYLVFQILPLIFIRYYPALVVGAAIGGVGLGLRSNALSAIVADVLDHDQHRYRHVNAQVQMWLFVSRAAAASIGGLLYLFYKPLPLMLDAACVILAAGAASLMVEPAMDKTAHVADTAASAVKHAVRYMKRSTPQVLRITFALSLIAYCAGDLLFSCPAAATAPYSWVLCSAQFPFFRRPAPTP
jgi:MFS family permease